MTPSGPFPDEALPAAKPLRGEPQMQPRAAEGCPICGHTSMVEGRCTCEGYYCSCGRRREYRRRDKAQPSTDDTLARLASGSTITDAVGGLRATGHATSGDVYAMCRADARRTWADVGLAAERGATP